MAERKRRMTQADIDLLYDIMEITYDPGHWSMDDIFEEAVHRKMVSKETIARWKRENGPRP